MTDSQTLKYVCHDHIHVIHVMSDKQIPKICLLCITETLHFRVMLESQIPRLAITSTKQITQIGHGKSVD